MTDLKSVAPDPYDMVLADLRTKRDELDTAIRTLETIRDGRLGVSQSPNVPGTDRQEVQDPAGMFLGMSIVDAAKKLLLARKKPLSNAEILKDIQAGGVVLTGADPLNVVGSVLTRRFNTVGDVVRISRGTWGLKEWYPGRNFKNALKSAVAESAVDTPATEYKLQINDMGGSPPSDDDDL